MREILFRGKRIDTGEWVYGHYGEYIRFEKPIPAISIPSDDSFMGNLCYDVDPSSIGQYTGLTDKNGKKIFEGDVIRFNGISYMVKYFKNIARFAAYRPCFDSQKYGLADYCSFSMSESITIGNIHDNPELL